MCRRDPDVDNGQVPVEVMDESREIPSVTRTTHDAEPRTVEKLASPSRSRTSSSATTTEQFAAAVRALGASATTKPAYS
jgi:hypothetical protein